MWKLYPATGGAVWRYFEDVAAGAHPASGFALFEYLWSQTLELKLLHNFPALDRAQREVEALRILPPLPSFFIALERKSLKSVVWVARSFRMRFKLPSLARAAPFLVSSCLLTRSYVSNIDSL